MTVMKKMLKKSLALVLALVCVMNIASVIASAATVVDSGTCGDKGDNVKWTLDSEGTFTVSGEGEMENFAAERGAPWSDHEKVIKKIVIKKGVTSIGAFAFSGALPYTEKYDYTWRCENLVEVEISDSVVSIGENAFGYALNLKKIEIPDSVKEIGAHAFRKCESLKSIKISDSVEYIGEFAFLDCNKLEEVHYTGTLVQWNKIEKDNGNDSLVKAKIYCKGDINRDGKTNSSDALMALQHSVGKIELKSEQIVLADVYADNKINSSDALEILKISVGSRK